MNKSQLQELLRNHSLPVSGRKQQLIDRLLQHLDTLNIGSKPHPNQKYKPKPKSKLERWIDEEWVNVCEPDPNESTGYRPCGRKKADLDSENYPYCRPYYRINDKTPKTVNEIIDMEGEESLAHRCQEKRKLKQGVRGKPSYYRPESHGKSTPSKSTRSSTRRAKSSNQPDISLVNQYNQLKPCIDSQTGLYQPEHITDSRRHKLRVRVRDPVTGKTKTVKYGHPDYQDYTTHRDRGRRENYCKRSGGITCGSRPDGICDQTSPNFWARTSLWNYPMTVPELRRSVNDTKCRSKLRTNKK